MTYKRFRLLLSSLHFSDDEFDHDDKLIKIRPLLESVVENFQKVYRPAQDICVGESLVAWKGRLNLKQFNRLKRARFGIKVYKLCESKTGYAYDLKVYTGKECGKKNLVELVYLGVSLKIY